MIDGVKMILSLRLKVVVTAMRIPIPLIIVPERSTATGSNLCRCGADDELEYLVHRLHDGRI
jgi:hypothetical protein